jgi:hypothetical protein
MSGAARAGVGRFMVGAFKRTLRSAAHSRLGLPVWRRLKRWIDGGPFADLDPRLNFFWERTPPEEWKMLTQAWDDTAPLPPGAGAALAADSPALRDLRERYRRVDGAPGRSWLWSGENLHAQLDLRYFRGDSPYVWQYRDLPRATRLKYFIAGRYVKERDRAGLLEKLGEDGSFGCWSYAYPGLPRLSRDLLDSVNELSFLDRQIGLLAHRGLRVLDIGAGYGRLAWRTVQAVPEVADYCCVDAIPESTLLCDYYLRHRQVMPPARVVPLDAVDSSLAGASFDIAFNVHSFSECTHSAVAWWFERIARLRIPYLYLVPNEAEGFLSRETDDTRRDLLPLVAGAGYECISREPVYDDPAIRELLAIHDHHHLFRRRDV